MSDTSTHEQYSALAERFIAAAAARDTEALARLYAPEMMVWKNTDQLERTALSHLSTYRQNTASLKTLRYTDVRILPFEGGYAQQHTIVAELDGDLELRFPCCLIVRVRDGMIARIDEYFDSRAMTPIARATNPMQPVAS